MDIEKLQRTLLSAARRHGPSDEVPYAFAQRVMARAGDRKGVDALEQLAQGLWRAAVPCLGIVVLLVAWSAMQPLPANAAGDLENQLEQTVLAAVEQDEPADEAW